MEQRWAESRRHEHTLHTRTQRRRRQQAEHGAVGCQTELKDLNVPYYLSAIGEELCCGGRF